MDSNISQASQAQTVPAWLLELTFAVQYNPNCPSPFLVRMPGFNAGCIDNKSYYGGQTQDALGFGVTLEAAALAAYAVVEKAREDFRSERLAKEEASRREREQRRAEALSA
jgi:hypothetical protein